jgi:hypothetical protein
MAIDAAAGAWLAGEEGRTKRCGVLVRFWFLAQGLGEDAEKTAIAIRERRREPESGERARERRKGVESGVIGQKLRLPTGCWAARRRLVGSLRIWADDGLRECGLWH